MPVKMINALPPDATDMQRLVWLAAAYRAIHDGMSFRINGNGFVSLFTEWEG